MGQAEMQTGTSTSMHVGRYASAQSQKRRYAQTTHTHLADAGDSSVQDFAGGPLSLLSTLSEEQVDLIIFLIIALLHHGHTHKLSV